MDEARRRFMTVMGAPILTGPVTAAASALPASVAISVVDFGARCDRSSDDTAAVQKAIWACRESSTWRDLHVPGPCRITAPLTIDRPVDTEAAEFRILGGGADGGFYLDGASTLFDSHLPVTNDPRSEHIGFYGIRFEAANATLRCKVLSEKFLRIAFSDCWFESISAYDSPIYVQSMRFRNCRGRGWRGLFAKSRGCYDITFEGNAFEAAGALFETTHGSGVRFISNLFEGSSGPFAKFERVNGAFVAGNYTEGNDSADYIFSNGAAGAPSHGVAMMGNFIAVSARNIAKSEFWSVVLGDCRGFAGSGNFCNGRLYDDRSTRVGDLRSFGDGGYIALNSSGRPVA